MEGVGPQCHHYFTIKWCDAGCQGTYAKTRKLCIFFPNQVKEFEYRSFIDKLLSTFDQNYYAFHASSTQPNPCTNFSQYQSVYLHMQLVNFLNIKITTHFHMHNTLSAFDHNWICFPRIFDPTHYLHEFLSSSECVFPYVIGKVLEQKASLLTFTGIMWKLFLWSHRRYLTSEDIKSLSHIQSIMIPLKSYSLYWFEKLVNQRVWSLLILSLFITSPSIISSKLVIQISFTSCIEFILTFLCLCWVKSVSYLMLSTHIP